MVDPQGGNIWAAMYDRPLTYLDHYLSMGWSAIVQA